MYYYIVLYTTAFLDLLQSLLKTDPVLKEFILNPLLSKELKKEALDSVLAKKKASELTKNLFGMLIIFYTLEYLSSLV